MATMPMPPDGGNGDGVKPVPPLAEILAFFDRIGYPSPSPSSGEKGA